MGNNMERLGEPVAPLGSGDAMSASPGMSRLARSSAIQSDGKDWPEPAHSRLSVEGRFCGAPVTRITVIR